MPTGRAAGTSSDSLWRRDAAPFPFEDPRNSIRPEGTRLDGDDRLASRSGHPANVGSEPREAARAGQSICSKAVSGIRACSVVSPNLTCDSKLSMSTDTRCMAVGGKVLLKYDGLTTTSGREPASADVTTSP